jgi:hypothetical protein
MRRRDHVIRRRKVEIARGQVNDIAPGRAQLTGAAAQDRCRRCLDAIHAR